MHTKAQPMLRERAADLREHAANLERLAKVIPAETTADQMADLADIMQCKFTVLTPLRRERGTGGDRPTNQA